MDSILQSRVLTLTDLRHILTFLQEESVSDSYTLMTARQFKSLGYSGYQYVVSRGESWDYLAKNYKHKLSKSGIKDIRVLLKEAQGYVWKNRTLLHA